MTRLAGRTISPADRIELLAGDIESLPLSDESFDAVVVAWTLYFMADVERALDEINRVTRPGGRIVVNAITLENVSEPYRVFRARGIAPEVTMLNVSRAEPLAHYMRYAALNPIHIFAAKKPARAVEAT